MCKRLRESGLGDLLNQHVFVNGTRAGFFRGAIASSTFYVALTWVSELVINLIDHTQTTNERFVSMLCLTALQGSILGLFGLITVACQFRGQANSCNELEVINDEISEQKEDSLRNGEHLSEEQRSELEKLEGDQGLWLEKFAEFDDLKCHSKYQRNQLYEAMAEYTDKKNALRRILYLRGQEKQIEQEELDDYVCVGIMQIENNPDQEVENFKETMEVQVLAEDHKLVLDQFIAAKKTMEKWTKSARTQMVQHKKNIDQLYDEHRPRMKRVRWDFNRERMTGLGAGSGSYSFISFAFNSFDLALKITQKSTPAAMLGDIIRTAVDLVTLIVSTLLLATRTAIAAVEYCREQRNYTVYDEH